MSEGRQRGGRQRNVPPTLPACLAVEGAPQAAAASPAYGDRQFGLIYQSQRSLKPAYPKRLIYAVKPLFTVSFFR